MGSWGPARQPFVEQGAGSDRGARAPLALRRETTETAGVSAHTVITAHARLAHAARLGRGRNDRRADARCFGYVLVCSDTHNPRASVRVRRASPHAGEARAAPQPSHPRGERAVRRHACACVERIFGTKAEPQRIVATRPLCRVQHPVPHSSRLQGIHRVGPVTCDRVRLRPKLSVLAAERPTR